MSDTMKVKPVMDWSIYVVNRAKWGHNELRPYAGRWVAWSLDGSRILASDPDLVKLRDIILGMGMETDEVFHECLPDPDVFDQVPV